MTRLPSLLFRLLPGWTLLALVAACGDDGGGAVADGGDAGQSDTPDTPAITGAVTPVFDPDGEGFFRTPWPSDARVDGEGRLVLDDFPGGQSGILADYVDVLVEEVHGFSTMPVVFIQFDTRPGVESFPQPADTLVPEAPVQLLDVSAGGCGTRVPIEVRFESEGDDFRPDNTLMVAPVPGFPLEPARPYALVVRRSFGNPNGLETARPPAFDGLLEGTHPDAVLAASYAPLRDCLPTTGLTADDIAVATVFTTQDPTEELRRIRAVVIDPEQTPAPEVRDWTLSEDATRQAYRTYTGVYDTPIFQRGETPYASSGGGFRFEDDGTPIVQRQEAVPFAITYPTQGSPPYPVLLWEDGTGADLLSHVEGEPVRDAIAAGFAVATFQPQFHGTRSGSNANPEAHTFNFVNPESFRCVFRQQVVDQAYFIRVVREALDGLPNLPALDTDRLVYGGHSQGAIAGAITAGVETEISAYVLNGVGAYLSITAVERKDPVDFNAQIRSLLHIPGVLDRFHPIIALIQTGGDVSDPINYARYWRGFPGHEQGSSLYLINGKLDATTPETSIDAMTLSGAVTPLDPPGWDVDPYSVGALLAAVPPITGNTVGLDGTPQTIATWLSATTGHFTIYGVRDSRALAVGFWSSALEGTPVLDWP